MLAFEEFITINGRYPYYGPDPNYYDLWNTFGNDISKSCFYVGSANEVVNKIDAFSGSSDVPRIEIHINPSVYTDSSNNDYMLWLGMNGAMYRSSGVMTWYCLNTTYGSQLPDKYLPSSLRPCKGQL